MRWNEKDDTVQLKVNSMDGDSYFVLRLHGEEILEITGGTYEEIETGWYMITAEKDSVQIKLEQINHADYYIED